MKKSLKFLAAVAALVACVWLAVRPPANAQGGGGFVSGPKLGYLLSNETAGTVFVAVGGGTAPGPSTNLSGLGVQLSVPIGPGGKRSRGCGILCNLAGTNSTTTTNVTLTFEFSADGVNWHTNDTIRMVVTPLGTGYAPVYSNAVTASMFGTSLGNVSLIRLKSVHHTNTGSIFITNLVITTR